MTCKIFNILNDEDSALQAQLDAFAMLHPDLHVLVCRADDLPHFSIARQVLEISPALQLSAMLSPQALEDRTLALKNWAERESGRRFPLTKQAYSDAAASLSAHAFGDYMLSIRHEKGILFSETESLAQHCLIILEPRGWGVVEDLALATKIKSDRQSYSPELSVPLFSLRHELGHVHRCATERRLEPLFVDERGADMFALSDACGGLPLDLQNYAVDWRLINNFCAKLTPNNLSYAFTQTLTHDKEPDYDDVLDHMAALCEVKLCAAPDKLRPDFGADFSGAPQVSIVDAVVNGVEYGRVRQHYANVIPEKAEKVLSARLNQLAKALDQDSLTPLATVLAQDILLSAKRRLPKLGLSPR